MAQRTKWIEALLLTDVYCWGMQSYLARKYPEDYNTAVNFKQMPEKVYNMFYSKAVQEYLHLRQEQFGILKPGF